MNASGITSLDHVVVLTRDFEASVAAYETLLGRTASQRREEDGVVVAQIETANVGVELMSALGESARARRVRAALDQGGEGLKSLVFRTGDVAAMHRRAERVGLNPEPIEESPRGWRSFRLDAAHTGGVRLFLIEREATPRIAPAPAGGGVLGLDHVVVQTSDAERAAALYGARLGLDMRLDREVRGRRLLFFRCGDAVVEIAQEKGLAADQLWGLSWRVDNADLGRARLAAAGLQVSDVRVGAKPGTRVFTVRDGTCGVPTLMIELSPNRD